MNPRVIARNDDAQQVSPETSGWSKYDARDFRAMKAGRCFNCGAVADYTEDKPRCRNLACEQTLPRLHVHFDPDAPSNECFSAVDDNYDCDCDQDGFFSLCPRGSGRTEQDAIADLLDQIEGDLP